MAEGIGEELVYGPVRVARAGLDIVAEGALRYNLPGALLTALAYGESGFVVDEPGGAWRGDNGRSVNWFQVNAIHPGWPDRYLGIEGIRNSISLLAGRWQEAFAACGGWEVYAGLLPISPEEELPPLPAAVGPPDPAVPRLGRAAFLYHWWPRAQGSVRPTWQRALEVDAVGAAVWEYYQDVRLAGAQDPRVPHLVGALDISRREVRGTLTMLEQACQRLEALTRGIDQALA